MKWKLKTMKMSSIGDTREVKKFLLFPRRIGEEIRWLETVKIEQKLIIGHDVLFNYDFLRWKNMKFIDYYGG